MCAWVQARATPVKGDSQCVAMTAHFQVRTFEVRTLFQVLYWEASQPDSLWPVAIHYNLQPVPLWYILTHFDPLLFILTHCDPSLWPRYSWLFVFIFPCKLQIINAENQYEYFKKWILQVAEIVCFLFLIYIMNIWLHRELLSLALESSRGWYSFHFYNNRKLKQE